MNTQLLCTFTAQNNLRQTIDVIVETYDVLYNKIFVLSNVDDSRELMCTYNIEKTQNFEILNHTISLHRKKTTNTLYTINALYRLIESLNNGVLDTSYQVNWQNYRNSILLVGTINVKRVNTKIYDIINV